MQKSNTLDLAFNFIEGKIELEIVAEEVKALDFNETVEFLAHLKGALYNVAFSEGYEECTKHYELKEN